MPDEEVTSEITESDNDEATLPDEDAPIEETTEDKPEEPKEAEAPKETTEEKAPEPEAKDEQAKEDPKDQAREHYWQRQVEKKDEYITKLESELKDKYVAEGEDDVEKRIRGIEADRIVEKVTNARQSLVTDHQRAQNEFVVFNPTSPDYNPQLTDRVMAEYANTYLEVDKAGEVMGTKVPLYDYLKDRADLIEQAARNGAKKGQQAEASMRGQAVVPSSAPVKGAEKDPGLEAFNAEFD